MIKTVINIEGMACGMCEAHVNEAIRNAFKIKKVESSHKKGVTSIISEEPIDEELLKTVIEKTGYKVIAVKTETYEKKGFFGFFG